jgi:hypothetical protein
MTTGIQFPAGAEFFPVKTRKWLHHEADHPPPYIIEFKIHTSLSCVGLESWDLGQGLVGTAMSPRAPQKAENVLFSLATLASQEGLCSLQLFSLSKEGCITWVFL